MEPEHSSVLLAQIPPVDPDPRVHEMSSADADPALPADRRRLLCLRLHWEVARDDAPFVDPAHVLAVLAGGALPWTRDDLIWSLRVLATETGRADGAPWRLPAIIGTALPPAELRALVPAIETVLDAVRAGDLGVGVRRSLSRAYTAVLDRIAPDGSAGGALDSAATDPGVRVLLRHAETLAKPVPTGSWLRTTDALRTAPGAATAVTALLEGWCATAGPVADDTDMLLRGLSWLAAPDPGDEATELLARVAVAAGACAPKTAAAAVEILARRPGEVSVRALARLSQSTRSRPLLTRVRAALERIGISPGEALELAVGDHGLDADGRRSRRLSGTDLAVVEIEDDKARLRVVRDGRSLKRVPADADVADDRNLVREITKALAAERDRIESLLSQERTWTFADWSTRYLDHPITGVVARRLIWQTSADGRTWRAGIPRREPDGSWTLADAGAAGVGAAGAGAAGAAGAARVRLWHPALAAPGEVARWRDHLGVTGLRQPFKQAFREVYPLTPAEVAGGTSTQRFASHILRYRQASALMRARGWAARYLGTWDQGRHAEAAKHLGGGEWRAMLAHEVAGEVTAPHYQVAFCATGAMRFAHRAGGAWREVPLTEVPPLVFSEAMRDVDLFVGVTSIAADEAWQERGTERFPAYREAAGFGRLTASAEVRRDVLARLLPRLSIGPRCELTGRFLRVHGNRGTYRIHLGSANILIEPNDAYLCIVPDRRRKPAVPLPFDDDRVLSLILSKAILLAADDTITDPTIVPQLPAGPVAAGAGSGAVTGGSGLAGAGRLTDRLRSWWSHR